LTSFQQAGALRLEGKPLLQFYCAEWNSYIRSADDLDERSKQNRKVYKVRSLLSLLMLANPDTVGDVAMAETYARSAIWLYPRRALLRRLHN
jgi:hypothetical protein